MRTPVIASVFVAALALRSQAQTCQDYWSHVPHPGLFQYASTQLSLYDDGSGPALYSGGFLSPPPTRFAPCRWRSGSWEWLIDGVPPEGVQAPIALDTGAGPHLYTTTGPPSWQTFHWDGARWQLSLQGLFANRIDLMTSFDDGTGSRVYARHQPNMVITRFVVRWDGSAWTTVGQFSGNFTCMGVYDNGAGACLFVGGNFNSISGIPARNIAKWDGQSWSAVGSGLTYDPRAMVVFDDGSGAKLCTIGEYGPEGHPVICMWDGQQWTHPIGGTWGPPFHPYGISAIAAFDDGTGPGLVVAGSQSYMLNPGGALVPVNRIARWNGKTWAPLGAGLVGGGSVPVHSLIPVPDVRGPSLFLSGEFTSFGGGRMPQIAQWVGCPNCYPDCDADQRLDVNDFVCFLQKYAAGDPYANCTVDATMTVQDFVCFLNKFSAGCP